MNRRELLKSTTALAALPLLGYYLIPVHENSVLAEWHRDSWKTWHTAAVLNSSWGEIVRARGAKIPLI